MSFIGMKWNGVATFSAAYLSEIIERKEGLETMVRRTMENIDYKPLQLHFCTYNDSRLILV